jgi:hypothetical protein
MQHGRNHDERLHHMHHQRANNLPEDGETAVEAALARSGRKAAHGGPLIHEQANELEDEDLVAAVVEAERAAGPEPPPEQRKLADVERPRKIEPPSR